MAIQDKFNRTNVIYKITKDIDLGGETLTIPEGCTLDFQGGSFSNGSIVGNNTAIKATLIKIFGLNVEFTGAWNVSKAYPEWFGAVGNGIIDDAKAINNAILVCKEIVLEKTYAISTPIDIQDNRVINGRGWLVALDKMNYMVNIRSNCSVSVNLNGNNLASGGILVRAENQNVKIQNCEIKNIKTFSDSGDISAIGIEVGNRCTNISVSHCNVHDIEPYENGKVGDGLGSGIGILVRQLAKKCIIHECVFDNIKGFEDGDCIHVFSMLDGETYLESDTTISNCNFYNMYKRGVKLQCNGAKVINCNFTNLMSEGFNGVVECVSVYGNNNCVQSNVFNIEKCRYCINITGTDNKILSNSFCIDTNGKYNVVQNSNVSILVIKGGAGTIVKDNVFVGGKYTGIKIASSDVIIDNNIFLVNAVYAIFFELTTCQNEIIRNNTFKIGDYKYAIASYQSTVSDILVTNNAFLGVCSVLNVSGGSVSGSVRNNIAPTSFKQITSDSDGDISNISANFGQFRKETYGTEPPSPKNFTFGDICTNSNPTRGGYIGWVLTTNGWLGYGLID